MLAIRWEMCIMDEQGVLPCSYGLVAQLGERSVRIREVEGSNPFRSTNTIESEPFADWQWVRIYCFVRRADDGSIVRRPGIIFPAAAY